MYYREYHSGHTVANHTYSHSIKKIYSSVDSLINDVKKHEDYLSGILDGYKTNIFRFPGGSPTAGSKKTAIMEKLYDMNYGWVNWDLETGDGNYRDEGKVSKSISNVIDNLGDKKVVVILMHDYSYVTKKSLPTIIDELSKRDYIFLPLFYESTKINKGL